MNPMIWDELAPMLVAICLILTVGGVLIFRPLAKRLGELLEVYARDKERGLEAEVHQVRELLETMNSRLQLMEERQDFTERLLATERKELAPPPETDA